MHPPSSPPDPHTATLSAWLGKTKTSGLRAAAAHIKSLPVGERFSDARLSALVHHHPGKTFAPDQSITFALRARPPYYTKALFVEARSGGFVDCSWKKCVAHFFGKYSKEKAHRTRALNALRNEAFNSEKMKAARESLGRVCADCGKECRKLVIDHAGMPFAQIVDEYVASKETSVPSLPVRYHKGAYRLRSEGKAWRLFHDERAELVGLCKGCNLRLGSRGYRSQKPSE